MGIEAVKRDMNKPQNQIKEKTQKSWNTFIFWLWSLYCACLSDIFQFLGSLKSGALDNCLSRHGLATALISTYKPYFRWPSRSKHSDRQEDRRDDPHRLGYRLWAGPDFADTRNNSFQTDSRCCRRTRTLRSWRNFSDVSLKYLVDFMLILIQLYNWSGLRVIHSCNFQQFMTPSPGPQWHAF